MSFNSEHDPDLDSIADRVDEQSKFIDELRQWRSKISGGLFVSAWFIGRLPSQT